MASEPTELEVELLEAARLIRALAVYEKNAESPPALMSFAVHLEARAARVAESAPIACPATCTNSLHEGAAEKWRRLTGPLDTPSAAPPSEADVAEAKRRADQIDRDLGWTRAAPPTSSGEPRPLADDLEDAVSLLRLFVSEHKDYDPNCDSNGGLSCYSCRAIRWMRERFPSGEKFPAQQIATAVAQETGAYTTCLAATGAEAKGADIEGTREGANLGSSEFVPASVPAGGSTASPAKSAPQTPVGATCAYGCGTGRAVHCHKTTREMVCVCRCHKGTGSLPSAAPTPERKP